MLCAYYVCMVRNHRKRINLELSPEQEIELDCIMRERHFIDRTNTLRYLIAEGYKALLREESWQQGLGDIESFTRSYENTLLSIAKPGPGAG